MTFEEFQERSKEFGDLVSRETFTDLKAFEVLFRRWSKVVNLVAPTTLDQFWLRHALDSLQVLPFAGGAARWADLGSGGGFPGLVVAIVLKSVPEALIDLVESNRKKCAFLQAVVTELKLPARVHSKRIEDAVLTLPPPQVVTARALAPLTELLAYAEPWLTVSGKALFHKGRDYQRELAESAHRWDFEVVEHRSIVANDSVILEISNLRRRP